MPMWIFFTLLSLCVYVYVLSGHCYWYGSCCLDSKLLDKRRQHNQFPLFNQKAWCVSAKMCTHERALAPNSPDFSISLCVHVCFHRDAALPFVGRYFDFFSMTHIYFLWIFYNKWMCHIFIGKCTFKCRHFTFPLCSLSFSSCLYFTISLNIEK